jgi:hypothetical protein
VACLRGVNGRVEKGGIVREAGGAGMILANNAASGEELLADPHLLPATMLTFTDGLKLLAYINSTGSVDPETTCLNYGAISLLLLDCIEKLLEQI